MAGFAPQLQSNIGFDSPINEGAGGIGVLSSLSSLLPAKKAPKAPPKPTLDERMGKAWGDMFPDTSIQESSLKNQRAFAKANPSGGAKWISSQAEAMLNEELNTEAEKQKSQNAQTAAIALEWGKSPESYLAAQKAQELPEKERDLFLAEAQTSFWRNRANQNALRDRVATNGANKANREDAFRLGGSGAIGLANAMSSALRDFTDAVNLDPNAAISLDEVGIGAIMPQLGGVVLTKNNVLEVNGKLRDAFKTMTLDRISAESGIPVDELGLLPEALETKIFKTFDTMNLWTKNQVDPAQIKQRSIDKKFNVMVEAGVPLDFVANVQLLSNKNPTLEARIIAMLTGETGKIMEMYDNGDFDMVKKAAEDMSSLERTSSFEALAEVAKAWGGSSTVAKIYEEVPAAVKDQGFANNTMAALELAKAEVKGNLLIGENFYKQNIEKLAPMFEGAIRANPEFKPAMVATLTGDWEANMTFVKTEANRQGFELVSDGEQVVLVRGGKIYTDEKEALEDKLADLEQFGFPNDGSPDFEGVRNTPDGLPNAIAKLKQDLDTLINTPPPTTLMAKVGDNEVDVLKGAKYRYNVLGNLGEIGKQVLLNANMSVAGDIGAQATDALKAGQGSVTAGGITTNPLPAIGNGPIAQNLGIDFATYEKDNKLPTGYLETMAMIESGGRPNAKNRTKQNPSGSSAGGLFQQIDANAEEFGVVDRFDPVQSTEGAVKFAVQNATRLRKVLGREPTGAELYLAHQQGGGGASALLRNPDRPAIDVLTEIHKGNAVRAKKALLDNKGKMGMTAGQFTNLWVAKFNNSQAKSGLTNVAPSPVSTGSFKEDTDAAVTQAIGVQPQATSSLGVQPVAPASEAGAFVQTPSFEGENITTARTGGEAFRSPTVRQDAAVDKSVSDNLRSLGSNASALHGEGSDTTKKINDLIKTVDGGGRVRASDVTELIRETKALPRTPSRQELLADLYELRDEATL